MLNSLHRLRPSQILTAEIEVFALHDLPFSPTCRWVDPHRIKPSCWSQSEVCRGYAGPSTGLEAVGRCGAFLIQFLDVRRRVRLLLHHSGFFPTMRAHAE